MYFVKPAGKLLQWGRGLLAAEMATASRPYKGPASLQWGRGLLAAEIPAELPPGFFLGIASMGPRLVSRGNQVRSTCRDMDQRCFNGAAAC